MKMLQVLGQIGIGMSKVARHCGSADDADSADSADSMLEHCHEVRKILRYLKFLQYPKDWNQSSLAH
jgi:hypothetical protein